MEVQFTINGKEFTANSSSVPLETSLNTFIRDHAHLRGTKFMCQEGGCGACIVTVTGPHPVTKEIQSWGVNSCLTPIFSCHGLNITTVEGVGNRKEGYDKVQSRLVQMNGIQCGYCSPGMVMNMYSLLESKNGKVTMEEVENSFGGNICRCTGYRPILDAFKSLAVDAEEKLISACKDIEDLTKICPKTGTKCAGRCKAADSKKGVHLAFEKENCEWHKVYNLNDIFAILEKIGSKKYMFVGGNTAHGVYRRDDDLGVYIDITGVEELRLHSIGTEIIIGGNVSLTETMEIFEKAAKSKKDFEYVRHLVKHIDLIANVPIRNSGTIAGNLSIKHQRNEFPSDLFVILEAAGAKLTIASAGGKTTVVSPTEYLKTDMTKKLILKVSVPSRDPTKYIYRSYKIMPRAQNAHAYVNAAFLVEHTNSKVVSASVTFGGINPTFVHATETEKYLVGKDLWANETLTTALATLSTELKPDWVKPDASPEFRKNLAMALFYKFVLNTCPNTKTKPEYKSGGNILERPISSGQQTYDSHKDRHPINQAVPRVDGIVQASGETQYANDVPYQPGELWAAFVPATKVNAKITGFDPSAALALPGVKAFYSAKDIPGENNFTPTSYDLIMAPEVIFCLEKVEFYGQPAGLIVAETNALAHRATKLVKITYDVSSKEPILPTTMDVLKADAKDRIIDTPFKIKGTQYGTNVEKTVKGTFNIGPQYHFTMEPQTTVAIPTEDGLDVYSATQWMDMAQSSIANCIKVSVNQVQVHVRRLGGGYGGKITRPHQVACAAALAAHKLNKPVRMVLSIETNMEITGKRNPCYTDYTLDVDNNGKIQKMHNTCYQDYGCSINEPILWGTSSFYKNCYQTESWDFEGKAVVTNSASNTWCRAPGSTEAVAMIETMMEHIAKETGKDPLEVRLQNIAEDNPIRQMLTDYLKSIDYEARKKEVDAFNAKNRWTKKGISVVPLQYQVGYFGHYNAFVAIYHVDGTVAISHGGIEMGQGINTKVCQVAAKMLGIPIENVIVKPSNSLISANTNVSGGSITSESVAYAVLKACEILNERIKPIRDTMPDAKWEEVLKECNKKDINLTENYYFKNTELTGYPVYGIACAEVEVDILSGNLLLNRVDIMEDTGESLSPLMDIGQVEGAFVMGLGYWLTEAISFGEQGELLNNRTWTYKPPGPKDIPIDFRVNFLKNTANEKFVLRSKATGEPPLCMAIVVVFALKYALDSARKDAGLPDKWYNIPMPATPENIFLSAGNDVSQFTL